MNKLFNLLGMTIGGWAGWALGATVSIFTAFILSVIGTGLGLWAAQWSVRRYF